jgi:hypothetical protein
MDRVYIETVRLLLEIAPTVFRPPCFAMKGGTALNLFVHEMPRLSVDIDLVYLDYAKERKAALSEISAALAGAGRELAQSGLKVHLAATAAGDEAKLIVRRGKTLVKIEVNHVFRGTVLPIERLDLGPAARGFFAKSLSEPAPILAVPELYASKLVAALDR